MIHRTALLASLVLVAGAPCGAQSPTQTPAAPSSVAASGTTAERAASSANPSSSTASSSAAAPAKPAAGADSAATGSKPVSSATDASSEPSPEVLKEARREGFKPKKRNGVTQFCYSDATLGTRFETEKCYDQQHMEMLVQQREDQRNLMRQPGACSGSSCSGH
jgi:hypothetical protein